MTTPIPTPTLEEKVEQAVEALRRFMRAVAASRSAAARLYQAEHNEDGSVYTFADIYDGPAEQAPPQVKQVWQRDKEYQAALDEEHDAEDKLRPFLRRSF